jgi:hypothetical protein
MILGQTPTTTYLSNIENSAFHDLTSNGSLPLLASTVLGLGLKFIPTPPVTTTQHSLDSTLSCFECDVSLRVFFAGDSPHDDYKPSPLQLNSTWLPPPPPNDIYECNQHFADALCGTLLRHKSDSNLSQYQQKILRDIKANKNIIIASADKKLGPFGVDTTQYIEWEQPHLLNLSTYEQLTEVAA